MPRLREYFALGSADLGTDEFLNQIVYNLYARAHGGASDDFGSMVVIDHPLDAEAILRSPQYFQKNFSMLSALGSSRFSANGKEWEDRRVLTQPAYIRAGRADNQHGIYAAYRAALSCLRTYEGADIQRALLLASSSIFYQSFGLEIDTEPLLQFFEAARSVLKKLQYFSWKGPTPAQQAAVVDEANALIAAFTAQVFKVQEFSGLLEKIEIGAKQIPNFSAVQELLMNFFAGIETTAATLCWAIDRLGADQRAQHEIYQELLRDDAYPRLDSFLNETMRYFPAIPFVIREATNEVAVGDLKISRGRMVLLSIVGVHHHPEFWDEPHVFNSLRSEFAGGTYDRRALIPFLAGPRICGGMKLAHSEVTEGMKAFVREFQVQRQSDEVKFDYGLALRPNSWQHLTITRR